MNSKTILASILLSLLVCSAASRALAQVRVFHSPNDDGTSPAELVTLPPGTHSLHLYVEAGSTPSQTAACDLGDGEEICQWLVNAIGEGPVTFQWFVPVGDVRWSLDETAFSATGGDFDLGQLGVFKLGDLVIASQGSGSVALSHGEVALADLSRSFVESGDLVLLPEPGTMLGLLVGILGLAGLNRLRSATRG